MTTYVENTLKTDQLVIFQNTTYKTAKEWYEWDWGGGNEPRTRGDEMGPKNHIEKNRGVRVSAPLPENIPFAVGNEVNEIFDFLKIRSKAVQLLTGGAVRTNIDRGLAERQFWRGIINQDISVDLNFNAYYSGKRDVVDPVGTLLLMAAPVESSVTGGKDGLLTYWKAPPRIAIRFGSILWFSNCIIKNVNVQWSNKLDSNFDPLSATVNVTFITEDPMGYSTIYTQSRIDTPRE